MAERVFTMDIGTNPMDASKPRWAKGAVVGSNYTKATWDQIADSVGMALDDFSKPLHDADLTNQKSAVMTKKVKTKKKRTRTRSN